MTASIRANGIGANVDPTVRGARVVPSFVREDRSLGVEPGGGLRGITGGVRVVTLPNGAMLAADDRLPQVPALTTVLPDRLGGGFLFVLGTVVWRADRWLSDVRPIYTSPVPIHRMVAGLDRVYLRASNGSHQAIDARTGTRIDLGPWPASSFIGPFAAVDGWRAVAISDLRGAVATFDAGATWRPLALPIEAKDVTVIGDMIAVSGQDRTNSWFEVRPDGQIAKLGALPLPAATTPASSTDFTGPRTFGQRPLIAALEDGWPLTDGTALVARDGSLGRIRLSDGALVEVAADAFPLKPARCHPVPLGSAKAPNDFGFVCGEVRGKTVLYAYDAAHGTMLPTRQFAQPRIVVSSGNGALAVHGPCGDGVPEKADEPAQHDYCLRRRGGDWEEFHVRGQIGSERIVVLGDGRVAVLSPPTGDLSTARLTLLDKGKTSSVPVTFHAAGANPDVPLANDVARALRLGIWLDGFEERRPGILAGWVEAGGSVLGLEITLDGDATHGAYIRDAGTPMVSGRYGIGWTASRRGFETIDGGMTWTPIAVPEPIAETSREGTAAARARDPRLSASRACGPIGCNAAGWLRIGWGASTKPPPPEPPPIARLPSVRPNLYVNLTCEPLAPAPPKVPPSTTSGTATPQPSLRSTAIWGTYPPVFGGIAAAAAFELPPFYSVAPPGLHPDERGMSAEATDPIERYPRTGPLARIYAWGPKSGDWDHAGRWIARWVWPYSGSQDVHVTQVSAPPALLVEAAKLSGTSAMPSPVVWSYGLGDDANHALLFARRGGGRGDVTIFEVESDRAPLEVRRADGEPFTEIDASVRAAGHWFLATPPLGESMATVWQVDGPIARELVRVPRAGMDGRPLGARLARRADGRAIGFVVDGQPTPERSGAQRWVLPIDLETGTTGEPELLGASDFGDRDSTTGLPSCGDDDPGWILDAPWNVSARLTVQGQDAGTMHSLYARVRVSQQRACIERIAGNLDGMGTERAQLLTRNDARVRPPAPATPTLPVTALAARARYPLRCTYP